VNPKAHPGRRAITIIAATALTMMAAVGVASAAAEDAKPCGYSESEGRAWYNHCTSDGSLIVIKIDMVLQDDRWYCVGPGVSRLWSSANSRGAWYTGDGCSKVGPIAG
jgi:hypothetical protein